MEEEPDPTLYALALVAAWLVIAVAVFAGRTFGAIFDSMNVELPYLTELVINGGRRVAGEWYVAVPLLLAITVGATWPIRKVPRERRTRALVLLLGATLLVLGLEGLTVWLPITKLHQALEQK